MSFRVAHQILSLVAREVVDHDLPPYAVTVEMIEAATVEHTGNRLGITEEVLHRTLDAWTGVEGRRFRGGTAPERVRDHINVARTRLAQDRKALRKRAGSVARAARLRDDAFRKMVERYG